MTGRKNIVVTLDYLELEIAMCVAGFRLKRVLAKHLNRGHGDFNRGFQREAPGAIGEVALAKHLGWYWSGGMDDFGQEGDVNNYQVRGSFNPHQHLMFYETDKLDQTGVLVTINAEEWPRCIIRGTFPTEEALRGPKAAEYHKIGMSRTKIKDKEQWWVPQSDLRPLSL